MAACFKVVFDCDGEFMKVEPVGDKKLQIDGEPLEDNPIDNVRKTTLVEVLMGTMRTEEDPQARCCIVHYGCHIYCVPCKEAESLK